MLYSDSLHEMMQNAVNESFWDAHGVEIGPRAIFDDFRKFSQLLIFLKIREIFENRMHWEAILKNQYGPGVGSIGGSLCSRRGPAPRAHRTGNNLHTGPVLILQNGFIFQLVQL